MSLAARLGWTDSGPDVDIDIDELLHVISNSRRRTAIRWINSLDDSEKFGINDLTDALAEMEYGADFDSMQRQRIYITMHQNHLETLEEIGVILSPSTGHRSFHAMYPGPSVAVVARVIETVGEVVEG